MKKVGICGHFGEGENLLNGQTIKTKCITEELIKHFGEDQIWTMDSHGGLKAVPKMLIQSFQMFRICENIIMMPAYRGLCIFTPLFVFLNSIFHRKIHYIVIGGWIDQFIDKHPWLYGMLIKFYGIYVETSSMKRALEKRGFRNITVLPNFKNLQILKEEDLEYVVERPYKLCLFSRIMKEKGIEDAIEAVKRVNAKSGDTIYTLDLYGEIDSGYRERFMALCETFPEYVLYRGAVDFDKSVEYLKQYFALLFPTHYYTEGIPGTIIDAYAAGIPVISSKWESFTDVIDDKMTGIGYEFSNIDELIHVLENIAESPEIVLRMKKNCLLKAKNYMPETAMEAILRGGGV